MKTRSLGLGPREAAGIAALPPIRVGDALLKVEPSYPDGEGKPCEPRGRARESTKGGNASVPPSLQSMELT